MVGGGTHRLRWAEGLRQTLPNYCILRFHVGRVHDPIWLRSGGDEFQAGRPLINYEEGLV